MRRTDFGSGADGRGDQRRKCPDDVALACLCRRCGDIAGAGLAGGRALVRGNEAIAGRGRMGAPCAGCSGADGRGGDRLRIRHGFSGAIVAGQHHALRTGPDRQAASDTDSQNRRGGGQHTSHRRHNAGVEWRGWLAEFAAAYPGQFARQGRAGRFLDLFLHQLSARAALRPRLGGKVQGSWPGGAGREFAFEKDPANVKKAVENLGVTYPVALDSNLAIWQAFNNQYWPAHYFIDGQGRIRAHHFGEGEYDQSDRTIQTLLKEAGYKDVPGGIVDPDKAGAMAAADENDMESPETYLGYGRGQNFASGPPTPDKSANYQTPYPLGANQWGFTGRWTIGEENSVLAAAGGTITFHSHAPDLHLVLGPAAGNKPVRFKVMLDGQPPGAAHGVDSDADGNGTVTSQRLYQLIRQQGSVTDHTFSVEFLDSGVEAYSFTFG